MKRVQRIILLKDLGMGTCGAEDRDHECFEICDELFRGRAQRDCEDLRVSEVLDLDEFHRDLQLGELDVDTERFHDLLAISPRSFAKIVKSQEDETYVKRLLQNIADDDYFAEAILDEDKDFKLMDIILEKAKRSETFNNQVYGNFYAMISGLIDDPDDDQKERTLLHLSLENEVAKELIFDYLKEKSENDYQMWQAICQAALQIPLEDRYELLDSEVFEEYFEDLSYEFFHKDLDDIIDASFKERGDEGYWLESICLSSRPPQNEL